MGILNLWSPAGSVKTSAETPVPSDKWPKLDLSTPKPNLFKSVNLTPSKANSNLLSSCIASLNADPVSPSDVKPAYLCDLTESNAAKAAPSWFWAA